MQYLHKVTFTLLLIGGLNWLLLGLFNWEIGALLGGMGSLYAKAIYILVGLAAIYEIATHARRCKECKAGSEASAPPPSQPQV